MATIQERKADHIRINLERDVKATTNPWDHIRLQHNALPEVDLKAVDLTTTILGKTIRAPVLVSGMTGGAPEAQKINKNLAIACEELGLGMGIGSQRAALVQPDLVPTYSVIREHNIPLRLANLGVPQLVKWGPEKSLKNAMQCVEMVDAHALAIHLNYLQEAVQPEGDTAAKGSLKAIENLAKVFRIPILVKETGAGISGEAARALARTGIKAIDVGGWGGTSFSAVEVYRASAANDALHARIGQTFWDWGIPTPHAVKEVSQAVGEKCQIIATGGIRTGLDAARALAMGADAVAIAGAILPKAAQGPEQTVQELRFILEELRTALFLCGAQNVDQFHQTATIIPT
jgi:isopentenyl-diphosphate Delta-isomerase